MKYILNNAPNESTKLYEPYLLLERTYGNEPFDYREAHQAIKYEMRMDDLESAKIMYGMLSNGNFVEDI